MTKSKLEWKKTRVAETVRKQMAKAVEQLNETASPTEPKTGDWSSRNPTMTTT